MKKYSMYSFVLLIAIVLFTACGTDQKENPPEPDGPYSFFDASTPLKITKPSTSTDANGTVTVTGGDYNITVRLLEYNLAKAGEAVQMRPFASAYGFVTETVVSTDENGRATFIFNPPTGNDYNAIRGQDITIQAVYLNSAEASTTSTGSTAPDILLTQDFVLQFR